jgi:hypothetical protein
VFSSTMLSPFHKVLQAEDIEISQFANDRYVRSELSYLKT